MSKPILFLDVDGVLNCLDATVPITTINQGTPDLAYVPDGTRERLERLLDVYEPVWATAWMGTAHNAFWDHLGLPDTPWPYIRWHAFKLPAIVAWAGDRDWAWVDDDAGYEFRELGWQPPERFVDGLVIQPHPRVGLTDEHVEKLLQFTCGIHV